MKIYIIERVSWINDGRGGYDTSSIIAAKKSKEEARKFIQNQTVREIDCVNSYTIHETSLDQ